MREAKLVCAATVAVVGFAGCIKRTERITVLADGAAILQTTIEGDAGDLRQGDALPEAATGWTVEEHSEIDQDGNEKLTRVGERRVSAGQAWPDSYAQAGSDLEELALRFPTTLTIEPRADGVYYHFRRVYRQRAFAMTEYEPRQVLESDEMKELRHKKPEELTLEQRGRMADAALQAHIRKIAGYLDAALEAFRAQVPQDSLLIARRSALAVLDSPELADRIHRMIVDQEEDHEFEDLERRLMQQIQDAMSAALRDAGVQPHVSDAVLAAFDRVRKTCEITQDLGDEEWMLTLQMPGRIVAHNSFDPTMGGTLKNKTGVENLNEQAADLEISTDGGRRYKIHTEPFQIGWRFDGDALYDRDVVLMATSVVPNAQD